MNDETEQVIKDALAGKNLSKAYNSFEELLKDIDEGKNIFEETVSEKK